MPPPLVTVIIPCYNYGHLIQETLQSVLKQTYANWECLVIDDGSTDNTADVVKRYSLKDKRIKLITQRNGGQSNARNNGLKHAVGKYVQFLDADDLLQDDKLRNQVAYLESNPDVAVVYTEIRYFETDAPEQLLLSRDGKNQNPFPYMSGKGHAILDYFLYQNPIELGALLFRKEVIDRVGYFDETIKGVEDWDLCFRIAACNYNFHFLKQAQSSILMRYHAESFSTSSEKMTIAFNKLKQKMLSIIIVNDLLTSLSDRDRALKYFAKHMRTLLEGKKFIRGFYQLLQLINKTGQVRFYTLLYLREVKF